MTGVSRAPSEEGGVGLARAGRLHVLPQAPGQGAARSATHQLSGAQQPEVGSYSRVLIIPGCIIGIVSDLIFV